MKVGYFRIKNKLGLHARPAARLVDLAKEVNSEIKIVKGKKEADARSILDLLTLSCQFDDKIKIEVKGEDEDKAFWLICKLFEAEIGEKINGRKI
ncbi:MAG TPA: HPr family phosphocarrier protein [Candidatus Desulfofervidus auxilii]|uniref:HPr family phosphocarrier protein n=1 Tax=Desulfofervidus auxilii TaxID=1621989 RepID=A0A7C0Y7T6_DESA2|nr:MAG: HPr family phosphocarrier protein [Candidatus Korarchaeota archaeon]HDD44630.1 HPr family phosphocarrier protein [Candidatus Desulfofervidus auxilii]